MSQLLARMRGGWLFFGVVAGATVGGLLAGLIVHFAAPASADPYQEGFFKAMALHASATQAQETMVMCTGEIDTGLEGVFVLDGLTGTLTGRVLNPQSRTFTSTYEYTGVLRDLGLTDVKNPKFVMLTGIAETRQGARGVRLGRAVLYIGELTSGRVLCYGVTYDPAKASAGQQFVGEFKGLDKFIFRKTEIR